MINQNSDVKEPRAFRPGRLTVPMHPAKRLIHSKTSVPAEPNPHSKPSSSMAFSGFRLRLHALSAFHKIFYSSRFRPDRLVPLVIYRINEKQITDTLHSNLIPSEKFPIDSLGLSE